MKKEWLFLYVILIFSIILTSCNWEKPCNNGWFNTVFTIYLILSLAWGMGFPLLVAGIIFVIELLIIWLLEELFGLPPNTVDTLREYAFIIAIFLSAIFLGGAGSA